LRLADNVGEARAKLLPETIRIAGYKAEKDKLYRSFLNILSLAKQNNNRLTGNAFTLHIYKVKGFYRR